MADDDANIRETHEARRYKRLNWGVHVGQIEAYFQTVGEKARNDRYFEALYVSRDDANRQIQLFAGAHPVGAADPVWDAHGRLRQGRLYVERGAALVISQSIQGDVAVILYPYVSDQHRRKEDHIIWCVLDNPSHIAERALRRMVKDFFVYIKVSSLMFTPSSFEEMRINLLLFRGQRYVDGTSMAKLLFSHWFWIVLGAVGSVASIYSLWR